MYHAMVYVLSRHAAQGHRHLVTVNSAFPQSARSVEYSSAHLHVSHTVPTCVPWSGIIIELHVVKGHWYMYSDTMPYQVRFAIAILIAIVHVYQVTPWYIGT